MKMIARKEYALSVCAAAAILGGCGSSAQFLNPTEQTPVDDAVATQFASSSLEAVERVDPDRNSEILRDLKVRGHCHNGGNQHYEKCFFHTTVPGTATGPYPGTFTARGGFSDEPGIGSGHWGFGESFAITSGAYKIKGTIYAGGVGPGPRFPGVYQYTTTVGYSGNVKIQSLGKFLGSDTDFREIFYGM